MGIPLDIQMRDQSTQVPAPRLTIAIPTFDRNDLLTETVAALLPQMRPGVVLVIRDNASPVPVATTLAPLLEGRSDVLMVRNPVNVGGGANILRCLETCETEWLWILGDDDLPLPDAIDRVLDDLDRASADLVGINYRCELYERTEARELRGIDDFLAGMDSMSNVLLLSTNVVRASRLRPHMRLAYAYLSTWIAQVAVLMFSLGQAGQVRLSMERIVHWAPPDPGSSWSVVSAALAFPTALDLPLSRHQRRLLLERLEADVQPELLGLARQLLHRARAAEDGGDVRWLWRQIRLRRFGGRLNSGRACLAWMLGLLLLAPRWTQPVVEAVARWQLGAQAARNVLQDPLKRL